MITQKPLSVRLNISLYDQLQMEVVNGYRPNRIINKAVAMYLDAMDTARNYRMFHDEKDLQLFMERWIPIAVLTY